MAKFYDYLSPFHAQLKVWLNRTYHQILYYLLKYLPHLFSKSLSKVPLSFSSFPFLSEQCNTNTLSRADKVHICSGWEVKMAQEQGVTAHLEWRRWWPQWEWWPVTQWEEHPQKRVAQYGVMKWVERVPWHRALYGQPGKGVGTYAGWDCQRGRVTQCRVWDPKKNGEGISMEV